MKTIIHNYRIWPAGDSATGQMDIAVKRYPFALLLSLSLAIHLLMLLMWPVSHPKQLRPGLATTDFSIRIKSNFTHSENKIISTSNSISVPAPTSTSVSARIKTALAKTVPVKTSNFRKAINKSKAAAETLLLEPIETIRSEKTITASTRKSTERPAASINRDHVISRLQQKLKQYFYYPRLARRKNIQGTVILGFAINPHGKINNIRVVKSSGFAVLDMAAEDALQKLRQLDNYQNWQQNSSDMELPVIYKLTES